MGRKEFEKHIEKVLERLRSSILSELIPRFTLYDQKISELEQAIGQLPIEKSCGCSTDELKEQLLNALNQNIELITSASPPGGRRPNITGKLIEVNEETIRLQLGSGHDAGSPQTRIGVYQIKDIIGFAPASEGGCGENDPITEPLQELVGRNVELITTTPPYSTTGVLLEVTESFVTLEVEDEQGNSTIVTLRSSDITGYVDRGRPDTEPGQVFLTVTVQWPDDIAHPEEVDVSLIREDGITIVTTVNGVATFVTEPSGDVAIRGEDVPGFITPAKQIRLTGNQRIVTETLEYVASNIPVTGIILDQETLRLLPGEQEILLATILPENASNQLIYWSSSNLTVATVNEDGEVTAIMEGTAVITARTAEGNFVATSTVTVSNIESVISPQPITAVRNQIILLPDTVVVELNTTPPATMNVPVTWRTESGQVLDTTFVIPNDPEQIYTLIGDVYGTDLTAELVINVDQDSSSIPVSGVSVEPTVASLYVGQTIQLLATVSPENVTTPAVIWRSSNTNVANVSDTGIVSAISPGIVVITVETVDGGFTAFTQLTVSLAPEIELIYPTQETFASAEEVMINVENLVDYVPITEPTTYYVRVEQSGSNRILGLGEVKILPTTTEFNLYVATLFESTSNFSARYFVYMSTDPTFPPEEDLTLRTNFTIGSTVPTIPKENINVNKEMVGGPLDGQPGGITFLLARELDDIPIEELTWENYWDSTTGQFNDEVKMTGVTNSDGMVIWNEPRETLKIGGYVLLEVTPEGYQGNLNLINPDSEDGSLIKEVHLTRNVVIERRIVNIYVG